MNETEANARIAWHVTLLRSIEQHAKQIAMVDIAPAGSEMAEDDALLAPLHMSHLVTFCIGIAEDALRTTRAVIDTPDGTRIPFIGLYPLLRTALESAALVTWVLAPDTQSDRLRRSIGVRWSDVLHDDLAVRVSQPVSTTDTKEEASNKNKLLKQNSKNVRIKKNDLRRAAERLGVTIDEHNGVPGFGPLLDEIALGLGLPLGQIRGTWHFISGLTHPSVSRAIGLSDVERLTTSTEGVFKARMTARSETVAWAFDAVFVIYREALLLVEKRSGQAGVSWPQPGEATLPPEWEDAHA